MHLNNGEYGDDDEDNSKERYRSINIHKIIVGQEDGSTIEIKPRDYLWYIMCTGKIYLSI